jgi:rhodanese-related sulfurtransferase
MSKYTKSSRKSARKRNLIIGGLLVVLVAAAGFFVLPGLLTDTSQSPISDLPSNRQIDIQEGLELYQEGTFTLDVRTPEEFQAGHIPGATLIPLSELAARANELPQDEPILIYCRSGNRSLQALNLLENAGFQGLTSMDGGFSQWVAAGYPAEYP